MTPASPAPRIPQPRPRPIVGNAPDIDSEAPIQSMVELARQLGPIYRLSFGKGSVLVISSLELVADACDETRFDKKVSGGLYHLRDFVGDGLFTAYTDEPNWAKAHRILMPAFGPAAMRNYFDDMLDIADQMLTKWERLGPEASIDVSDNMTRLTLDTIALCGFGYRFNSYYQNEMHPLIEAMVRMLSEAGSRARRLPIQTTLMLRTQRQYEADGRYLHSVTDELIAKRRRMPEDEKPRDLLGLMLEAKDPVTGERLDDVNIRYQLLTFLIAGHETTSGLLSFATYFLLKNPDILRKAQAEADRVLGAETPRFEHIAQLGYIDQILRETLRLWSTAPGLTLSPKHDTVLAGKYPLKKRSALLVLLPALHRDPAVWKEPEKFDPDRFAPGVRDEIPQHAWKPFGNGQRGCIGRAFAMQEATLVLAMLLQRFEIWEATPYELVVKEALTLKPDGLRIRARVRQPVARAFITKPAPRRSAEPREPQQADPGHGTRCCCSTGPTPVLRRHLPVASQATAKRAVMRQRLLHSTITPESFPRKAPLSSSPRPITGSPRTMLASSQPGSPACRTRRSWACGTGCSAAATAIGPRPISRCRRRSPVTSTVPALRRCCRAAKVTRRRISSAISKNGTARYGTGSAPLSASPRSRPWTADRSTRSTWCRPRKSNW